MLMFPSGVGVGLAFHQFGRRMSPLTPKVEVRVWLSRRCGNSRLWHVIIGRPLENFETGSSAGGTFNPMEDRDSRNHGILHATMLLPPGP